MRNRIASLLGGRRRRSLLAASVAAVAAGVFAISALAVHDLTFQLDGDVSASTTTNVGGNTQTVDWDSIFDANGAKYRWGSHAATVHVPSGTSRCITTATETPARGMRTGEGTRAIPWPALASAISVCGAALSCSTRGRTCAT